MRNKIIRLKNKELGDKVAKALNPIAKIGGEVWNFPTEKGLTDQEKTMLFNIGMPYPIDNYVLIEEKQDEYYFGHAQNMLDVKIKSDECLLGKIVKCVAMDYKNGCAYGALCEDEGK